MVIFIWIRPNGTVPQKVGDTPPWYMAHKPSNGSQANLPSLNTLIPKKQTSLFPSLKPPSKALSHVKRKSTLHHCLYTDPMEGEDQALFHAYPCAYYVQSPSTLSRANSADCQNNLSTCHSPLRSETFMNNPTNTSQEVNRFSYLSRYSSSSRGSNNSFLHEKKIVLYDAQSQGTGTENGENGENRRRMSVGMEVDGGGEEGGGGDDEEEEYYYGRSSFSSKSGGGGWWRYFSFRTSSSCLWICLQISWRLMVSLGAALLVFCIATKPPPPMMSIKVHISSSSFLFFFFSWCILLLGYIWNIN